MDDEKKPAKAELKSTALPEARKTVAELELLCGQPAHAIAAAKILGGLESDTLLTASEFITACESALGLAVK